MTHLSSNTKSLSLWRRILLAFNVGGPQWGRPQGEGQNNKPEDEQQNDWEKDEEDQQADERQPRGRPSKPSDSGGETPPDLDEIWKDLSGRLGGILGGGGGGSSGRRPPKRGGQRPSGRPPVSGKSAGLGVGLIAVVALLGWAASGLFTVQEGQRAVILTFGKHTRTVGSGLSWRLPYPIERHEVVATDQLRSADIGNANINSITGLNNASMLTQDKNILDIRYTVQYRISNIEAFLFNNVNPDDSVIQAAESAVREVVGRSPMDVVIQRESCSAIPLTAEEINAAKQAEQKTQQGSNASGEATSGVTSNSIDEVIEKIGDENVVIPREVTVDNTKATCDGTRQESLSSPIHESIQSQLDKLNTGIEIFNVNILDVQVPDKVKPAFDEARSATAERASLINEGWAYANATVASAKGVAARLEADASAYKASVVSEASGETQRFTEIWEQYRLVPEVTRKRMYLEAMQEVYSSVSKIMMESGNNSLLYVPIDKLMSQQGLSDVKVVPAEGLAGQTQVPNVRETGSSSVSSGSASNTNNASSGTPTRTLRPGR